MNVRGASFFLSIQMPGNATESLESADFESAFKRSSEAHVSTLITIMRANIHAEDGQTLVEYGLILALVSIVAIAGLSVMGGDVVGLYSVLERLATTLTGTVGV